MATNHLGLCCSSYQVATSLAQVVAGFGSHYTLSQEAPDPTQPVAGLSWYQSATKTTPAPQDQPSHNSVPQYLLPSGSRPDTSNNQPWFTAWPCLGNLNPAYPSVDCFVAHTRWPPAEYRWQLTLACTSQKAPELVHPMDSFRPQSTTQPLPQATHSRGELSRHQSPAELSPALWHEPLHS